MQALVVHAGLVVPLDRANIDTDAIVPKAFLKSVSRTGFAPHLFDDWRYLDAYAETADDAAPAPARRENPDFVLNRHPYRYASILLARANFGCGSSREHAVWALMESGIRVVVAESFADIFRGNAIRNGLLPVSLPAADIDALFGLSRETHYLTLTVDLRTERLFTPRGRAYSFFLPAADREQLLSGRDEIDRTLERAEAIRAFERQRRAAEPWV